jgi:hypothetical protein
MGRTGERRAMARAGWMAVVLGGAALAALALGTDGTGREEKRDTTLPADLGIVPANGGAVVTVRLGELWDSDFVKPVRKKMARDLGEADKKFAQVTGVPLEQVERLSAVFMDFPANGDPFLVLATTRPYDRDRVLAALGGAVKEEKHQGRTYYQSAETKRAAYLIDRQAFAAGTTEQVRRFLQQPAGKEGPLTPALRQAAGKHLLVVGFNVPAAAEAVGDRVPPEGEAFKPLLKAESATLTLDVGAEARATLLLPFGREADAKAAEKSLEAGLQLAQKGLAQALQRMGPEEGLAPLVKQLEGVQTALKEARVERRRTTLEASAHAKVDVAAVGVAAMQGVQKTREAASRTQSTNNLKQIALAMHNYHDTNRAFPPQAVFGKDGKPLLSWRVLLLPYLEEQELYKQFKLDEPWDSEHNKKLLAKMPRVYKDPGGTEKALANHATYYQGYVGKGAFFEGKKGLRFADFPDGTSNTLMIVEAATPVPWTKPEDIPFDPTKPLPKRSNLWGGGFLASMCDGSVRLISKNVTPQTLRNAITRNDGNPLGPDF